MTAREAVLNHLKESRVAKASELNRYASNPTLLAMSNAGEVFALGSGYYAHPTVNPQKGCFVVVAKYYPQAVISNLTALSIHELTDERIDAIDIDIPNTFSIRNKLLKTHRVQSDLIKGVIEIIVEKHVIRVYSPERALCDIYKSFGRSGVFFKSLKRYVKSFKIDYQSIAGFDKLLGTEVLTAVSQEVADE